MSLIVVVICFDITYVFLESGTEDGMSGADVYGDS